MPSIQRTTRREEKDISTPSVLAQVQTTRRPLVSINIEATGVASYAVDVSHDGEDWFEAEVVYDQDEIADPTDIRDTFEIADAYLRVRVTEPASNGETADVTIQEAR